MLPPIDSALVVDWDRLEPLVLEVHSHVNPTTICSIAPVLNLTSEMLLSEFATNYMHAQLCNAALHAFAAENEARMEAMASARNHIERQLSSLQATQRLVRQEEITAEVIVFVAGETASRPDHN